MANPCGCGDSNPASSQNVNPIQVQQEQVAQCPATVRETVCVQANVTITPSVEVGDIQSFCVGRPRIGSCAGTLQPSCTFTVSQDVCVQIPLTFSANATAVPAGLVCGIPTTGPCVPATFECCAFIMATQGTIVVGEDTVRVPSLSIQLCGPANQCSPEGNHINVVLPGDLPNFQINLTEMLTMVCDPQTGLVTVTAQANVNTGTGMQLANFTFTFDPTDNTVDVLATAVVGGAELINTTITLTGNVRFQPCTPPTAL